MGWRLDITGKPMPALKAVLGARKPRSRVSSRPNGVCSGLLPPSQRF